MAVDLGVEECGHIFEIARARTLSEGECGEKQA